MLSGRAHYIMHHITVCSHSAQIDTALQMQVCLQQERLQLIKSMPTGIAARYPARMAVGAIISKLACVQANGMFYLVYSGQSIMAMTDAEEQEGLVLRSVTCRRLQVPSLALGCMLCRNMTALGTVWQHRNQSQLQDKTNGMKSIPKKNKQICSRHEPVMCTV